MPITHEGAEYFSKAEIENIVKDRVKNVEQTSAAWERKAVEAEAKAAQVATLASELDTWKNKAAEAAGALTRYQAAASVGVTDADTIWLLEQAHARTMAGVEESKRADFATYLGTAKTDPTVLPAGLRGVFGVTPGGTPPAPPQGAPAPQAAQPAAPVPNGAPNPAAPPQPATQTARPAWAPAVAGQSPVNPGQRQSFTDRVAGAKSLDDIAAIQRERHSRG